MKTRKLTREDLADFLFPLNQYPFQALDRVISGRSALDEHQISRLSIKYGISIDDLFNSGWKARATMDNRHIFTCGEYMAELDINTMWTKFFKHNELTHEEVLSVKSITLVEYINFLNSLK